MYDFVPSLLGGGLMMMIEHGRANKNTFYYSYKLQKGHLHTYRFCDEVWTFLIENVNFKMENNVAVQADKVKIVSCSSKKPGEA